MTDAAADPRHDCLIVRSSRMTIIAPSVRIASSFRIFSIPLKTF
jgi:hypothetical protein